MKNRYRKNIRFALRSIALFLLGVTLAGSVPSAGAQDSNVTKVKEAMRVMKEEAAKVGEAKALGISMYFGPTKMNGNYTIVDALKTRFNCTATLFSRKGTDFVRVSTNVLNEGNRAVGTVLDVNGSAYAALSKGEPYYGVVDILGKKYDAGYEPVKNQAGETIGAFYVGIMME